MIPQGPGYRWKYNTGTPNLAMGVLNKVYGPEYEVPHLDLGLLGLGVGSYLAAATLSQGLLAIDRARSASVIWSLSACIFLASYWAFSGPALLRISAGFALATTAAAILLGVQLARCVRPAG